MRASMRAFQGVPRICLFSIVKTPVGAAWRRPTPFKVQPLAYRPFSSTFRTFLKQQREEEFERLAKELEEKNLKKRARRVSRSNYWYLGLLLPFSLFCFYYDQKVDSGIWFQKHLTPFTIIKRENVSSTAFILTLRPQFGEHNMGRNTDPYAEFWEQCCWAVKIIQPELQIARYYTPLPPLDTDRPEELRFLIRKIEDGEVSVYLDRLPVGAETRLFQPGVLIPTKTVDNVTDIVFLAGGTGIASAMGLAYSFLERQHTGETPKIHILWASRRREDCLGGENNSGGQTREGVRRNRIVKELDDLQRKHPGKLSVEYVVDEEGTAIDENRLWQATRGVPRSNATSKMIFISGPDGFVDYFAGPMVWKDGKQEQGPLGGLLGRMRLAGWTVRKL